MKLKSPRQIASAFSIALIVSGCSLTDRLDKAATTTGKIQASINLPSLPIDCRKQEPHFAISDGMEARTVIVGERSALNRSNARVTRCASLYDSIRSNFGNRQ